MVEARTRAHLDTAPDFGADWNADFRIGVLRDNLRTRRVGARRSGGSVRMHSANQRPHFHLSTAGKPVTFLPLDAIAKKLTKLFGITGGRLALLAVAGYVDDITGYDLTMLIFIRCQSGLCSARRVPGLKVEDGI